MKSIVTKYHGPTNTRGSRISATAEGGHRISVSYPYEFSGDEAHAVAAKALKEKLGWKGKMVAGGNPDGSVSWVFKDDSFEINPSHRKRMKKNPMKERIAAARHARSIRRTPGGRQLARSVIAYGRGRGLLSKNPRKRSSKKKLSPKQAAWRKKFIKMVRARAKARGTATRYKFSRPVTRATAEAMIAKHKAPRRNPVRSKLLCIKNRAGKWWYLKNAGSALHGPELTDDKSKARRFATDSAAMQVAARLKSVLVANGFVTAKTH